MNVHKSAYLAIIQQVKGPDLHRSEFLKTISVGILVSNLIDGHPFKKRLFDTVITLFWIMTHFFASCVFLLLVTRNDIAKTDKFVALISRGCIALVTELTERSLKEQISLKWLVFDTMSIMLMTFNTLFLKLSDFASEKCV